MSEKCPFIKICGRKIRFTPFVTLCLGHSYVFCDEYKRTEEREMTPREWEELLKEAEEE
jgi:hypothetical protein